MNKYENILVDTVGRIKESFGGEALRNGKRLQGLCMDMSPQLMNQREYKMLVILIKCGGNEALLDALNDTPAVQERAVARLTQRMADEYVMDETAARCICALYMTAASGNSAYIDRLDAAGSEETARAETGSCTDTHAKACTGSGNRAETAENAGRAAAQAQETASALRANGDSHAGRIFRVWLCACQC